MGKSKKHHSKPHRDSAQVMRDMHGVAKFKRTGWGQSWEDMNVFFDNILYFKFGCRSEWLNKFHGFMDSYWYQYECGALSYKDIQSLAKEYGDIELSFGRVEHSEVDKLCRNDKYLRMVGHKNLERNNEILELHAIHEGCALAALHDIGWKQATLQKFNKYLWDILENAYLGDSPAIRENIAKIKSQNMLVGFRYEKVRDWLEDEKRAAE